MNSSRKRREPTLGRSRARVVNRLMRLEWGVWRRAELVRIFKEEREALGLGVRMTVDRFMNALQREAGLEKVELGFPSGSETLYAWPEESVYQIALALNKQSYLSHASALHFHGLVQEEPEVVYVNSEQGAKPKLVTVLTQEGVDLAFRSPQRVSRKRAACKGRVICAVSGKNTGRYGVMEGSRKEMGRVRVTDLERTLVDVAVRPAYAGGVEAVISAYRQAQGALSVQKLLATLIALDYAYPYHQVIGFYLEKGARVDEEQLVEVAKLPMALDFYLAHGMEETAYSARWRLFVPTGLGDA